MSFGSSRSLNLKRSFDSNSSNSSSKRKTKSGQKTLGAAWGSSSTSSSRSSFRSAPFSDFGSYMSEKNRKLHNQFNAEASSSSQGDSSSEKPIFQGVSIFVDGFTIPSRQELRRYMLMYGGRFENYFSRRCVTHIICSNLPDSKIKNLRSFSRGLPVVKPTWVLDSVVANRLLSWVPYQLDQLTVNQPKLSDFFVPRISLVAEEALINTSCLNFGDDAISSKGVTAEDVYSSEAKESCEQERAFVNDLNGVSPEDNTSILLEKPIIDDRENSEVTIEKPSDFGIKDGEVVSNEKHYLRQPIASFSSELHEVKINKDVSTSTVSGPSRRCHSTLEDPNFVENYFKNSRLHFIGTWRNRYRKRFLSSSSGSKSTWSGQYINSNDKKTVIVHIDMDCFFVSVVIRSRPELQGKPVAVCHSDNPKGTAEISSANYPARAYGVKAGMFVKDAKTLCHDLLIVPYNFEAYEEVADQFYDILHKHCSKVQAVSCDEAFLEITDLEAKDPEILASTIREEIFKTTQCSASAGIAENMLMARLATRTAKPAGQYYIPSEKVDEHLDQLPIGALPGIGRVLEHKLKEQNIETCRQLRLISKDSLQKDFGMKTGEMLWNYSRGLDHRPVGVIQESKTICAEVNWGVRFRNKQDTQYFLSSLCKEVSLRLQGCGVVGRTFTLKVKKRRKDAGEPAKYMGCGECENLSRSSTIPVATDEVEVLQRITKQLFESFHLDDKDVRGIGLQVSKLKSAEASKAGSERNSLKTWLSSTSAKTEDNIDNTAKHTGCIGNRILSSDLYAQIAAPEEKATKECHPVPISSVGTSTRDISDSYLEMVDVMPTSFSQVDISVLQELPEELRADILEELVPAHRKERSSCDAFLEKNAEENKELPDANEAKNITSFSDNNLWMGNPPQWVEIFKDSRSLILERFSEIYFKLCSSPCLSTILQHCVSERFYLQDASSDGLDEAVGNVFELFRQYVKLKIEVDIEEIYICLRLLKRLSTTSKFYQQVYDVVFPYLQASVRESYGGSLQV